MKPVRIRMMGRYFNAAYPSSATTSCDATLPPAACPRMRISITVMVIVKSVVKTAPAVLMSSRRSARWKIIERLLFGRQIGVIMDFSIKTFDAKNSIAQAKSGCIAVAEFEDKKLSQEALALDKKGEISAALNSGYISGKPGTTLLMRDVPGVAADRVLLIGLGKEDAISSKDFNTAAQAMARVFGSLGGADAIVALPFDRIKERDAAWGIRAAVLAARENAYRFDEMKSKKDPVTGGVKKIAFAVKADAAAKAKLATAQAVALANGMDLTKTLGNLPANVCTPTYLADTAKKTGA